VGKVPWFGPGIDPEELTDPMAGSDGVLDRGLYL